MKLKRIFLSIMFLLVTAAAIAGPPPAPLSISSSPGASGTFTDAWIVAGQFDISISGTWVGTVTIQRSFDGGTTWVDVATFTSNVETTGIEPGGGGLPWRIGMKNGAYTSGTAVVRLYR